VAAFATDGLRIDHVTTVNGGIYGMALLASTNLTVDHNAIQGVVNTQGAVACTCRFLPIPTRSSRRPGSRCGRP